MRLSPRLLFATHANSPAGSGPLRQAPLALLPPIPLYRRLLRSHRKYLGVEERILGDQYIKSEFRLHRNVENPVHIIGFLTEWQLYAQQLEGASWKGAKMDRGKIDKMSVYEDQQIGQLYELMKALQNEEDDADNDGKQ